MATKATIIVILLAVATIDATRQIPEFLHICHIHKNTSHFEQCVSQSIEYLKPYLKVGVPEYNIPSLEPLELKKLSLSLTETLKIQANDLLVHGASDFTVSNVKAIFKDNIYLTVNVLLPRIQIETKYEINGKVLFLTLYGSGPLYGNFTDCIGACKIKAEKYVDKDGVEKGRITDFKMKITIGKGEVRLENLFDGEKTLGDIINTTFNNNFDMFMKEILPYLEKALSDAFLITAGNIVEQFPLSQLFPGAYDSNPDVQDGK